MKKRTMRGRKNKRKPIRANRPNWRRVGKGWVKINEPTKI